MRWPPPTCVDFSPSARGGRYSMSIGELEFSADAQNRVRLRTFNWFIQYGEAFGDERERTEFRRRNHIIARLSVVASADGDAAYVAVLDFEKKLQLRQDELAREWHFEHVRESDPVAFDWLHEQGAL